MDSCCFVSFVFLFCFYKNKSFPGLFKSFVYPTSTFLQWEIFLKRKKNCRMFVTFLAPAFQTSAKLQKPISLVVDFLLCLCSYQYSIHVITSQKLLTGALTTDVLDNWPQRWCQPNLLYLSSICSFVLDWTTFRGCYCVMFDISYALFYLNYCVNYFNLSESCVKDDKCLNIFL